MSVHKDSIFQGFLKENANEGFLGFYRAQSTAVADRSRLIEDVFVFEPVLARLRGLAFDRNVRVYRPFSAKNSLFVHCVAHCLIGKDS